MKTFRRLLIVYTVFMLATLAVTLWFVHGLTISAGNVASYDAAELTVYRQIWEQVKESYQQRQRETMGFACAVWGVALLLGYAFLGFVYLYMIKPVKEMEAFAEEIAKGNLDVPLPMHRFGVFESFTESFDLMREELAAAKEREREAEKAKREMVAELSHDLKTPVATIQATCEVMDLKYTMKLEAAERELAALARETGAYAEGAPARDGGASTMTAAQREQRLHEIQENIREIQENLEKISYVTNKAETIQQLVGNVFRATLDDMQEIKIEPKEQDSKVIEGYFRNLKEYGNVILDNHVPECLVIFDKLRMEQVIDNVVGNSYKYAGTDVHVRFEETESVQGADGAQTRFIKITIRDEGPGIPEEDLPLVTQKFYRGKNSQDKQGYGLGLYLVKWYMEKQGGGMEYHNDHGFVVELFVRKV